MSTLEAVCTTLAQIAPLRLAESWDNVGLLVGDRRNCVSRVMTCLTISPDVVEEAISEQVDLIVTHHPLPFNALQKITSDTVAGTMLLKLIQANVAIYSAHTAFDSAVDGINQAWATNLGLESIGPLVVAADLPTGEEGSGRCGRLREPVALGEFVLRAAKLVGAMNARRVGAVDQPVRKVALACGSGGDFLASAKRCGCDCMITGEASFHTCLEAEAIGIGIGLLGHFWSERFAMEGLADRLSGEFTDLTVWPSRVEHDPIHAVDA